MRVEIEPTRTPGEGACVAVYFPLSEIGLARLAPGWVYKGTRVLDVDESIQNLARLLQIENREKQDALDALANAERGRDSERKRRIEVEAELRLNQRQAKLAEKYLAQAKAGLLRIIEDDEDELDF